MSEGRSVKIRFFAPPQPLARLVSTLFLLEVDLPGGEVLTDHLLPEWAMLRFFQSGFESAENRLGQSLAGTRFPVAGPHSIETRFTLSSGRHWGVSLHPLGWARLVGERAVDFANHGYDGEMHAAFARFRPLVGTLFGARPDPEGELARIADFLCGLDQFDVQGEVLIDGISQLLLDPHFASVSELVDRLGVSSRTLERICAQVFGFTPKMLLRRRRFMSSLTDFTLDPSLKWIGAIDAVYHDQSHFVRDFRHFMGMTPSEYASLERPIMAPVLHARERFIRDEAKRALRQPAG